MKPLSKEFILTTYASDEALRIILSQGTSGKDQRNAHASRTLMKTKRPIVLSKKKPFVYSDLVNTFNKSFWKMGFTIMTDH